MADANILAFIVTCETGRPLGRAWCDVARSGDYVRTIAAAELAPRVPDRPGLKATLKGCFSRRVASDCLSTICRLNVGCATIR